MIYFLKAEQKIKIGYSSNPINRISSIQTATPYKLEVMLIINGDRDKESELHTLFKNFRGPGEWFDYSPEIKDFITNNKKLDRKYEFGFEAGEFSSNEQVKRIRVEHKLSLRELGEKLNITAQSVKEIQDRERMGTVSINVLKNVAKCLGYKFEYRFRPIIYLSTNENVKLTDNNSND